MNIDEIRKLVEELHLRHAKNYQKMNVNQLSGELRKVMEYERQIFKKIDSLENEEDNKELADYAKMICKNTTEREIAQIQEIYLEKIDKEYIKSN